jgi:hypothetical protein
MYSLPPSGALKTHTAPSFTHLAVYFISINMLGYAFMCLSTWFSAMVFAPGEPLSAWIRTLYILRLVGDPHADRPCADDYSLRREESKLGYVASDPG